MCVWITHWASWRTAWIALCKAKPAGIRLESRIGSARLPSRSTLSRFFGRDLVVGEAERVDEVAHLLAGHADGDVVEDHHLAPAEIVDRIVAIGQLDAQRPFRVAPAMAGWDTATARSRS